MFFRIMVTLLTKLYLQRMSLFFRAGSAAPTYNTLGIFDTAGSLPITAHVADSPTLEHAPAVQYICSKNTPMMRCIMPHRASEGKQARLQ